MNLLRGHVEVRQSLQRVKGGLIISKPKSKRSIREVPLRLHLRDALDKYLGAHPHRSDPDALLWPGRTRGNQSRLTYDRPFEYSTLYRYYFKPALKALSLPDVRFHDLRHSCASIWLAAGLAPYKVSRWLGHASLTTTDGIYGHLYPSDYSDEMARVEAYERSASATSVSSL